MSVSLSEIGSNAVNQWAGEVQEEWRKDLQGSMAMKKYREMIDESAALGGWYAIFEMLVRQADIRVDAGRETASARAERDRISESFNDMETPIDEIVGEIAKAGPFGFSAWEKVYKIRRGPEETEDELRSKYSDGRIGWFDLALRPQESLCRWEFDKKSRWTAFVQSSPPTFEEVRIPRTKLLHVVLRTWNRSPEGRSMLRSSVDAYDRAKGLAERQSIAGFKNAAGQLLMETPMETWDESADPDAVAARATRRRVVKDLGMFSMTEYSSLAIPPESDKDGSPTGWKLRQLEGAKAMFPYADAIKHWEARELLPVLCEHILLGIDEHGSFALGDSKTDLFALALGAILKRACSALTIAAAELSRINGVPVEDYAVVTHDDIETPDLTHMANFVAQILGVDPSRLNDMLRRYLEHYARLPAGALGMQSEAHQQADAAADAPNGPADDPDLEVDPEEDDAPEAN